MQSKAPRDATAFEVRDALREPGCAICRLTLRSVGRFLQSVAYEQVNDVEFRTNLRRARGFCNTHAHQWQRETRNVLGTALIYRDLLQSALGSRDKRAPCPACRAQADSEARYLDALIASVSA